MTDTKFNAKNILFLCIVLFISVVIATSYTDSLEHELKDSVDQLLEKQSIFEEKMHIMQTRHVLMRDIISTEDAFAKDEMIQEHARLATRYYQLRKKLHTLPLSPEEVSFLDEQMSKTRVGYNAQLELIEASIESTSNDQYSKLLDEVYPVTSRAYKNIRDYKKVMEDETRLAIEEAHQNYEHGWYRILAIYAAMVFMAIATFIWFSRKQRMLNDELQWKASHDNLTQLSNRAAFEKILSDSLEYHERDAVNTILYLDLDEFKVVNDSCGHAAGDELLIAISGILRDSVRKHDVVARLGGDEFGLLLMGCTQQEAVEVAETIRSRVHDFDFVWGGNTYHVGASIGVMEINDESLCIKEIMKRVDTVCYTAKSGGRNRVHVFSLDDEYTIRRIDEVDRADQIRSALRENRFSLYCQRFSCMKPGISRTAEILVRMIDERGNIISPDKFLPAATRFHLMHEIDRWVTENVLGYLRDHPDDDTVYNINLSAQTLNDEPSHGFIIDKIREYGVDATRLCFEITEDSAISNLQKTVDFMNRLHRIGCHFALDDFGTGLSSFTYLQKLPVDMLKIDGSFVKHLHFDSYEHTFIEAMCAISKNLDIRIVAEWVETDEVLQLLTHLGVDYAQGHLIAEAAPLLEAESSTMLNQAIA